MPRQRKFRLGLAGGAILSALALAGESAPPTFTKKPKVSRDGGKARIEFAVNRETDAAVFIEDAQGKIVRHLVAGMLGKNPPPPLKANSLDQCVEWDGKADYGKPAGSGPFRARVALGLGAKYDKVVASEPENIGAVCSLGAGPDGTLYVVHSVGNVGPGWGSQILTAFNRDGTYQRTLMPFPADLKADRVQGVGVFDLDGRPAPQLKGVGGRRFYSGAAMRGSSLAVTPSGKILYPLGGLSLAALDTGGGTPCGAFAGPHLFAKALNTENGQRVFVSASTDDRWVYVTGLGHCSQQHSAAKLDNPYPAVFRVKLPERAAPEVFFGDLKATGSDETRLGGLPSGLSVDGKGHVLVGDPENNRVVVLAEKDGRFAGAFPVEKPECVAADPASGAVYVTRQTGKAVELVKFSAWKAPQTVATLPLPVRGRPWTLAADFSAKPPVLWLGGYYGDRGYLLRVEDLGDKFGPLRTVNTENLGGLTQLDLSVEHVTKTVYAGAKGGYLRYEEAADKLSRQPVQAYHGSHQIGPAPDGSIYALSWSEPGSLRKLSAEGKPQPWTAGSKPDVPVVVSMNLTPHTLGVRPSDGHAFVFEPAPGTTSDQRVNKRLVEFGLDGKRVEGDPSVWCVSDAVVGPRFDAAGNVYLADQVRAVDQSVPTELGKTADHSYGSILKFSPATSVKGGRIQWEKAPYTPRDTGLPVPKPDPDLKVINAVSLIVKGEGFRVPAKVIGAEWMHLGISHVDLIYCNCETTRFDVDEFGRVFYPDLCRFHVGVLDTNGNPILRFGGYGNADSMGPGGPVIDPRTKAVRPRRPDDPKDLKSPFAEPEIAFAWLVGVCATDRYAYMGDTLNRRLLRAKLTYAAEETCALP